METANSNRVISNNNDIYMDGIMEYAKNMDFSDYAAALSDAWQVSITDLAEYIHKMVNENNTSGEEFDIQDIPKHRSSAVSLAMSLGFMKYYYETYVNYINRCDISPEEKKLFARFSGFILCDKLSELENGN